MLVKGDNILQQRLSSLKFSFPLPYNDTVQQHIQRWIDQADSSKKVLTLWKVYQPVIWAAFDSTDLPKEYGYLPLALSQMNFQHSNSFGSSGPWQLLFQDAKNYQLKITSFIDERKDPYKSTLASAKYLKDLLGIYNDPFLAMAAFVSGPKTLNKAIVSAGSSINYWSVFPFLPAETREVVPMFVAAVYMSHFSNEHGITPGESPNVYSGDTVIVDRNMRFDEISRVLEIPEEQMAFLNPAFKRNFVPLSANPYKIIVPKGKGTIFEARKSEISITSAPKPDREDPIIPSNQPVQQPKFTKVVYRVKPGETIQGIGDCFDVTPAQIKTWNRLRSYQLKSGQWLAIWVPSDKKGEYEAINQMNAAQKKSLMLKD